MANPTDRGRTQRVPRTKRHLVVERDGLPLAALLSGANRHDTMVFEALLDAIPAIKHSSGRRRKRPAKGVDAREPFWHHRWVIERTLAWLNR